MYEGQTLVQKLITTCSPGMQIQTEYWQIPIMIFFNRILHTHIELFSGSSQYHLMVLQQRQNGYDYSESKGNKRSMAITTVISRYRYQQPLNHIYIYIYIYIVFFVFKINTNKIKVKKR